jgi:hypothetical protein
MKILILHRIPYYKVEYHRGIDHERHDVTYVGTKQSLSDIPLWLRAKRLVRAGIGNASDEVMMLLKGNGPRDAIQAGEPVFDRVISLSEYELLEAAKIREALGIEGPRHNEVLKVRDKILMKQAVEASGIRVPRFMKCTNLSGMPWKGATVLKPVDGASSENVKIFSSLFSAVNTIKTGVPDLPGFRHENYELEEFVEGPIIHIDGIVAGGKVKCLLTSRYLGTCLDYARGKPLGSVQANASEELAAWAARCLKAVGINQGAFHLEAILSTDDASNGPVFLEVGNRVGGADVVQTFELATGIHLPSEELRSYLGEPLSESCRTFNPDSVTTKYGWFVFAGHHLAPGYGKLINAQSFRNLPQICKWHELPESQALPEKITYQPREVPLAGILRGSSTEEITRLMIRMFHTISVEPVPSVSAADRRTV